jgi:hypothetical protein
MIVVLPYGNPELTYKRGKLLWISVGNEDFLYKQDLLSLISGSGFEIETTKMYACEQ